MTKNPPLQYDIETQRRFLKFINEAKRPRDLAAYGKQHKKQVLRPRRPLAKKNENKPIDKPLIDAKTAEKIIKIRDERSPNAGFANFAEIVDWVGIDIGHWWQDWICRIFGATQYGIWEELDYTTDINVAQAALVHTPDDNHEGRVLLIEQVFGDTSHEETFSRTPLWKPEGTSDVDAFDEYAPHPPGLSPDMIADGIVTPPGEGNMYCSDHTFLSDGKLLAVGGGGQNATPPDDASMAWLFDPTKKEWYPTYDKAAGPGNFTRMTSARWYPTALTLGDDSGRVLIVGGYDGAGVTRMEVYSENTGLFTEITGPVGELPDPSLSPITADYPNLHLIRNGEIFFGRAMRSVTSPSPAKFTFDAFDTGRWTVLSGAPDTTSALGSTSALLIGEVGEPDRLIQAGKGSDSVRVIEVPPTAATPWQIYPFPDGLTRERVNMVLLPDGTVLIAGGTNAGTECYIFDPAQTGSDPFISVANMNVSRSATHEQVMLLPNAKIATFGSGREIEIFTPPYLYDEHCQLAHRPVISHWPNPDENHAILHGQTFTIDTDHANDIARVALVRPMSVTHQMDTEQRVIPLCFTHTGQNHLDILVPDGRIYPYGDNTHTHTVNPRGVYMLFIFNHHGVPSKARFVRLQ